MEKRDILKHWLGRSGMRDTAQVSQLLLSGIVAYQQRDYRDTEPSCRVALGTRKATFLLFCGGTKFTHAQYINMMYVLGSKFDDWIGVAFLSDNAKRSVKRVAETQQPIQASICDVWYEPA